MPLPLVVQHCADDPRSFSRVVASHPFIPCLFPGPTRAGGRRTATDRGGLQLQWASSVSQMTKMCIAAAVAATIAFAGSSALGADFSIKARHRH
jgi:hypothetical protein